MNFNIIYNKKLDYFPEQIDISDGEIIEKTNGFKSGNLTEFWNNAEERTTDQAENYFSWAYYIQIHRLSRENYINGTFSINTSKIGKQELLSEYETVVKEAEKINRTNFCCDMLKLQFENYCEIHDSKYDCPDKLIDYNDNNCNFSLIIHDGGSSGIRINFCPWCGEKL